ncbi:MAG: phosphoribosylanthranilate isomerase [Planctomycetes bacterium]|nr:phosphoribosylanthranilate isomerase [Planctomycetota bacterium]
MAFRIKICGITNLDDARAAADAGADAIGFNFFSKSRRFVDPQRARQIVEQTPAGVLTVGVFVNSDAKQIVETVEQVGFHAVQLHGDEPPLLVAQLPSQIRIVRAYRCGRDGLKPLANYLEECRQRGRMPDAALIDADAGTDFGGSGQLADWALIQHERESLDGLPLILAGGLTPDNVAAAIAAVSPDGVDVASGVEQEPGRKDAALIARFVAAARAAFARI